MSVFLYRLAKGAMRHAWKVVAAWVLALAVFLGGAFLLGGELKEDFSIPGTESQETLDHLQQVFPQIAGANVQVVIEAPDGQVEEHQEEIEQLAEHLRDLDHVDQVMAPWDDMAVGQINDDGNMAIIQVQYDQVGYEVTDEQIADLVALADEPREQGLAVEFSGDIFGETSVAITITEVIGVVFAGLVLFVTFWSFVAAGLPILIALNAVGLAMAGVLGAAAFTSVSNSAPLMAVMIGLAVGIDYSLFILFKYRALRVAGETKEEAVAMAAGTSGTAVVFAGLTVIIALVGLLIVNIPFLSVMGLGAALAVAMAVLAANTLLPALLKLAGKTVDPKPGKRSWRVMEATRDGKPTMGLRWVTMVTKRPVVWLVGLTLGLAAFLIPLTQLQLALPDNSQQPEGSTPREAYEMLQRGFGDGYPGPLIVAVDLRATTDVFDAVEHVADELEAVDGVASVGMATPNETADTGIVQIYSEWDPNSAETAALVERIREEAPRMAEEYSTPVTVTGFTAVSIDISAKLAGAMLPFGAVIVTLSIILLLLVFRSFWLPLIAAVGFILSLAFGMGSTILVLQLGYGAGLLGVDPAPLLSFMPVLTMAILFGLSMDYMMFIGSGIREQYVHGLEPKEAVRRGFQQNARVVTAAATIMFFVFIAFVPEGIDEIKAIAFSLAMGVLADAFLVRMTIVPAALSLMGKHAWWLPKWLDRLLPHVDVEGESLTAFREHARWAEGHDGHVGMEHLVVGDFDSESPAITASVPRGSFARVDLPAKDRLALWLTMSGALAPKAGALHVGGDVYPADASKGRARIGTVWTDSDLATLEHLPESRRMRAAVQRVLDEDTEVLIVDGTDLAPHQLAQALAVAPDRVTVLTGPQHGPDDTVPTGQRPTTTITADPEPEPEPDTGGAIDSEEHPATALPEEVEAR